MWQRILQKRLGMRQEGFFSKVRGTMRSPSQAAATLKTSFWVGSVLKRYVQNGQITRSNGDHFQCLAFQLSSGDVHAEHKATVIMTVKRGWEMVGGTSNSSRFAYRLSRPNMPQLMRDW